MKFKQIYDKHKTLIIAVIVGVLVFFATSFVFPFFLQNNYETFSADQEISYTREEYISGDAYDSDYEYEPSIASMALFTKESSSYSEEEERKIEKTAYISLEAEKEKYVATKAALDNVATSYGGYYTEKNENKRTYGDNEYSTYTITLKIPQEYFDLAVEDIKGIAELKDISATTEDRTKEYYDIVAYLTNYKEERERLIALYEKAETVEDLIKIEERLSNLQSLIDNFEAQLDRLKEKTDYSTITVTVTEKKEVLAAYYEMTGLKELGKNVISSFDVMFVFFSHIFGWIIIVMLIWISYKIIKKRL